MLENDPQAILLYAQAWELVCQRLRRCTNEGTTPDYEKIVEESMILFGDPTGTAGTSGGTIEAPAHKRK